MTHKPNRSVTELAAERAAALARLHGALDYVEATTRLLGDLQLAGTPSRSVDRVAQLLDQARELLRAVILHGHGHRRPLPFGPRPDLSVPRAVILQPAR